MAVVSVPMNPGAGGANAAADEIGGRAYQLMRAADASGNPVEVASEAAQVAANVLLASLDAKMATRAVTTTPLLSGVIATGAGSAVADSGRPPTFTGRVAGTGAVSATVAIEVRNDPAGVWVLAGTLTMSGTTSAGDGFAMAARYLQYRANVTAISGTSAAVTVTMGG